jgi:putative flippase GtrA
MSTMTDRGPLRRLLGFDVISFLGVGGVGYVVDVTAFNFLLTMSPFNSWDPIATKAVAVALAMVVTYLGNRFVTWRGAAASVRQVLLFVVFNLTALCLSILVLWISHDVLNLTNRVDDNISANVIGVALGMAFRYWAYRRFVFARQPRAATTATLSPTVGRLPIGCDRAAA